MFGGGPFSANLAVFTFVLLAKVCMRRSRQKEKFPGRRNRHLLPPFPHFVISRGGNPVSDRSRRFRLAPLKKYPTSLLLVRSQDVAPSQDIDKGSFTGRRFAPPFPRRRGKKIPRISWDFEEAIMVSICRIYLTKEEGKRYTANFPLLISPPTFAQNGNNGQKNTKPCFSGKGFLKRQYLFLPERNHCSFRNLLPP